MSLLFWPGLSFGGANGVVTVMGVQWSPDQDASLSLESRGSVVDQTVLVARPVPNAQRRWNSDDLPVEIGRAYTLSASVKPNLVRAQARLELTFQNRSGVKIFEAHSLPVFSQHNWTRFEVTAVAPEGATTMIGRLVVVGDHAASGGEVLFAKPIIQPGAECTLELQAASNVLSPGIQSTATLLVRGAPPSEKVKVDWTLRDFSGTEVKKGDLGQPIDYSHTLVLPIPGLDPGYYELIVSITGERIASVTKKLSFAVLQGDAPSPAVAARIGLDAGMSWSYAPDKDRLGKAIRLVKLAGVGVLRDRLSWSKTEPSSGKFQWGNYKIAALAQSETGMEVVQVFHDAPPWSFGGESQNYNRYPPRDPISMYKFANRLVTELGGSVRYLEVWNEPNGDFFLGRPEDYSAILKAAYLGAKDASSNFGVLLGAAAGSHPMTFFDRAFENGIDGYFDIFSQHFYGGADDLFDLIPRRVGGMLVQYGMPEKPIWITEMGLAARPANDGSYFDVERQQASYLVKAYASAYANGVDRLFYFYLKEFLEDDENLWGILRDDLSPKPAYVALANFSRILGGARCIGWKPLNGGYLIVFRRTDKELVAVAWGAQHQTLRLNRSGPIVDVVGRLLDRRRAGADIDEALSEMPVFIRALDESVMSDAAMHRVDESRRWIAHPDPNLDDKRVWLQLEVNPDTPRPKELDRIMLEKNGGAVIQPGRSFKVAAWVNNYSDAAATATVRYKATSNFELDGPTEAEVRVGPWQRARHDFSLSLRGSPVDQSLGVSVEMTSPKRSEVNKVYVQVLPSDMKVTKRQSIIDSEDVKRWIPAGSRNASVTIEPDRTVLHDGKASIRFKAEISSVGESWVFPKFILPKQVNLSGFNGIEFWSYAAPGTFDMRSNLVVQLVEEDGGTWTIDVPRSLGDAGWQRHVAAFDAAKPAAWKPDPDGRLDLGRVRQIMIGWGAHYGRPGESRVFWIDQVSAVTW